MPVNGDAACAPREGDARRLAHGSRRGVMLRPATPADAAAIADLYAPYVTASVISFEKNPPDASAMRSRIEACGDPYPWLVAARSEARRVGTGTVRQGGCGGARVP